MGRKKSFIFTNRKHSHKAIMGMILGIISLVSLGIVIFLSYRRAGEIPGGYGVTGFLALCFSVTGFVLGALTIRDRENFRLFPLLALILNAVAVVMLGILLYAGA